MVKLHMLMKINLSWILKECTVNGISVHNHVKLNQCILQKKMLRREEAGAGTCSATGSSA
jgi:hypothetical protein